MPRILIVGSPWLEFIAELLRGQGCEVTRISPRKHSSYLSEIAHHEIVYGEYLMNASRPMKIAKCLGKTTVMHIIGTDGFRFADEKYSLPWLSWVLGLKMTDHILYADGNLARLIGFPGKVVPYPIDTGLFVKQEYDGEKRDVLYYALDADYRPDWIVNYARDNPNLEITVLGHLRCENMPQNIVVAPLVERHQMPQIYARHRQLIRMTTHDAAYPRMLYEALRCGLDVIWNGKRVTEVPPEVMPEYFVRKFSEYVLESH